MKLLLIQSSHLNDDGSVFKSNKLMYPGLALPIVAALTPDSFDIELVNDYYQEIDFDAEADLVAIAAMTPQAPRAYHIADAFKKRGRTVVLGGFHVSLFPDEATPHCDSVVIGEAENTWPTLIEDFLKGREHLKPRYESGGMVDMASIPTPRYDLIDMSGYPLKAYPVQTTRGCPRKCDFCSVRVFFGDRYRHRPIDDVVRDVKATGSKRIFFVDDNIASNANRCIELCEKLKPLGLVWGSQCNVDVAWNDKLLHAMSDSGCFTLFLGVESTNPQVLKNVHKGFNEVEKYGEAFDNLKRNNIMPMVSMIVGLDGDDDGVFQRNYDFLMKHRIPIAYFFILAPAPGTEFFNRWDADGRLTSKDWTKYSGEHVVYKPDGMSPAQLEEGFWELYRKFYSLPSIMRRFAWPPPMSFRRWVGLKYNILHWKSLRKGLHPLRG